jgi:hypothetical protein
MLRTSMIFILLLFLAGCTNGVVLPKTYPATGSVVYKGGKPMAGGSIQLTSGDDPLLRVFGAIESDGRFTLSTVKDNARVDGAPAGQFQVIVTPPLATDPRSGLNVPHQSVMPITLPKQVQIEPAENTLKIEVPAAKS